MDRIIYIIDWTFLFFFVGLNTSYFILLGLSLAEIFLRARRRISADLDGSLRSYHTHPVSIIAPAFNERLTIEGSVRALLALRYPEFEVVVVNDGSTDRTVQVMIEAFDMYEVHPIYQAIIPTRPVVAIYKSYKEPKLTLIDKVNGGKADALNCGINTARFPLFCSIDADTLISPDALLRLALPFIDDPARTIATGGTVRVANGCTIRNGQVESIGMPEKAVPAFQVVEYLRAFLFGRVGWNLLGGTLIISGAFGLFSRDAVLKVQGYRHDTVGEDMELVVRLHRQMREDHVPYRIVFVWDSTCYTEVPESLEQLGRQRDRWHRGLIDSIWRHRTMFFNPRYGVVGMVIFPFFAIFEMLGPVVELIGLVTVAISYVLGVVDTSFMLLFLTVSLIFGVLLSVATLALEEISFSVYPNWRDLLRMTMFGIIENFGYRQLTLYWRLRGMVNYFRGVQAWGAMSRRGFGAS